MDIQRNVVIDEEDLACTVDLRVADVCDYAVKGVGVKVATAHFNDGAEAAIEGAAARGLDDVGLAAQDGVALEDACAAVGEANFFVF